MPTGPGRSMLSDCKSERIVKLRQRGVPYRQIAHLVGSTPNSCRVLYFKRLHERATPLAPPLEPKEDAS